MATPARPGRLAVLPALLLLAACAGKAPDPWAVTSLERAYRPPAGDIAPSGRLALRAGLEPAIRAMAEALPAAGLEVEAVDLDAGRIAAVYSGEAEPWLDCGWFVPAGAADGEWLPATRLLARIVPPGAPSGTVALRQLRLDARLVVRGEPLGDLVELDSDVHYLVTRTFDVVAADGRVLRTERATLVFDTGQSGRLDENLRCRSNGRLEQILGTLAG
ncbi:hypothetical protein SH611_14005 [Geminicoccaceae bacterium 1502E]|nr:hypothetical protein [Geminicoccaceae bacterium 1502E]